MSEKYSHACDAYDRELSRVKSDRDNLQIHNVDTQTKLEDKQQDVDELRAELTALRQEKVGRLILEIK